MVLPGLQLEPAWHQLTVGSKISVLADVVVWDGLQQRHLLKSAGKKVFFIFQGTMPKVDAVSLLEVTVTTTTNGFRIQADDGYILPHEVPDLGCMYLSTEVCAGIGCLGRGLETAGMKLQTSNELREPFAAFQRLQGRSMIKGDLGEAATIAKIHAAQTGPNCLAGGFSCQPWSHLGDRRATGDQRADTLVFLFEGCILHTCT